MRIWHEQLIPKLCRQHLLAVWREGLGAYNIITQDKKGYRNHPATQEFIGCPQKLHDRLAQIRAEMLRRGYNPKPLPDNVVPDTGNYKEWQDLDTQIEIIRSKNCECSVWD